MYTMSYPSGTLRNDAAVIEQNSQNADYQAYVAWLAQGNGPEIMTDAEPELLRIDVSAWQIRKALNATGLRQQVEDAVAASTDIELQDGWAHAPRFYSDHPMTLQMGAALGKTTADMYALFQLAESL